MEMDMIWSAILTLGIAFFGFVLRGYILELQRLQILINKTREEYVTKPDNNTAMDRVIARLDALDLKMDRMLDR
tara:strand:- start:194 stop:415 length:222 start_codon:yes stop_codon:yes gene_type:complete